VGAAMTDLVPGTGAAVETRQWLSRVRVFDSLKGARVVFGLGRKGKKRKCCEIRMGWDGGVVCTRPAIATKGPRSKDDLP